MPSFPTFLDDDADSVARKLLGCLLVREIDGRTIHSMIVETESYDEADEASHSYRGSTPRNQVMFGPSGWLYVYFTYGMHYCCNVVTGPAGQGSAVLIRAVEPLDELDYLERRRGKKGVMVTNGPAKLCSALSIDGSLNGYDLRKGELRLEQGKTVSSADIVSAKRIGITRGAHLLRRYYLRDNPYVSNHA